MGKKRKISGLSGIELARTHFSLLKLRESLIISEDDEEQSKDTGGEQSEDFIRSLDDMIAMMTSRLEGPQVLNFPNATMETLQKLGIDEVGSLQLKSGYEKRVEESKLLGKDQDWSSEAMYRHLARLEKLVPKDNEAAARIWIDAFFFRASAMVPPGQRLILNIEYSIPSTTIKPSSLTTISGITDYTAIIAPEDRAASLYSHPYISTAARLAKGFFVTEAKHGSISQHVAQALCELYAAGKQMNKDVLRGALTNGYQWIFIIILFNEGGDGASYKLSNVIEYNITRVPGQDPTPQSPSPDIIAGILFHWIQKSFKNLEDDDWLEEIQ